MGLMDLVVRLNLRQPCDEDDWASRHAAIQLGWVDSSGRTLTRLGDFVADPIREYLFWIGRGRRLHAENEYELLAAKRYEGKAVLEPGCGFGCNLLSLSRVSGHFIGLEPVALYRQFTSIFAERERLPVPQIVGGRCEALPFVDGQFDIVLCYSAHQYMDIRSALREMARVLRPGGQLQIVGGTPTILDWAKRILRERRLGALKHHLLNDRQYHGLRVTQQAPIHTFRCEHDSCACLSTASINAPLDDGIWSIGTRRPQQASRQRNLLHCRQANQIGRRDSRTEGRPHQVWGRYQPPSHAADP